VRAGPLIRQVHHDYVVQQLTIHASAKLVRVDGHRPDRVALHVVNVQVKHGPNQSALFDKPTQGVSIREMETRL
jgi:hypothetical protein